MMDEAKLQGVEAQLLALKARFDECGEDASITPDQLAILIQAFMVLIEMFKDWRSG